MQLSCSDGRAEYALLGTPGGDILEFIHGLNALEQTMCVHAAWCAAQCDPCAHAPGSHMPLTPDGIDRLFKEFLQHMLTVGKQYFYMHTDAQAKQAWHTAAGVPDPLNPLDADGRRALLKVAGCAASMHSCGGVRANRIPHMHPLPCCIATGRPPTWAARTCARCWRMSRGTTRART